MSVVWGLGVVFFNNWRVVEGRIKSVRRGIGGRFTGFYF